MLIGAAPPIREPRGPSPALTLDPSLATQQAKDIHGAKNNLAKVYEWFQEKQVRLASSPLSALHPRCCHNSR